MSKERERLVVGCMTGTSLDGLDVALTRITGSGLAMRAEFVGMLAQALPTGLRESLMHLASGGSAEPLAYMRAARQLGELHAEAAAHLLKEHDNITPDFIVAHGQTIWHAPRPRNEDAAQADVGPMSWQLFDPWPVVKRVGVPVCYDLRQADLIAGGEGAPLTPLADWVMYRHITRSRCVINLGGVCNITFLPANERHHAIKAEDIGPCNILLDGLTQRLYEGLPFDRDGALAESACSLVLPGINGAAFFDRPRPRSTGREDFSEAWLDGLANSTRMEEPEEVLAGASVEIAELICATIDGDLERWEPTGVHQLILAGGGAKNKFLVDQIAKAYAKAENVFLSDALGIPCEAREAMGFAVLGALSQDGVPISLPQVTGATDPGVAGVWAGVGNL